MTTTTVCCSGTACTALPVNSVSGTLFEAVASKRYGPIPSVPDSAWTLILSRPCLPAINDAVAASTAMSAVVMPAWKSKPGASISASWFAEATNADQLEGLRPRTISAPCGASRRRASANIRSLFCAVQVPSVSITRSAKARAGRDEILAWLPRLAGLALLSKSAAHSISSSTSGKRV